MTRRKRQWIIFSVTAAGLFLGGLAILATRVPISANMLHSRVIEALAERLDADVEIGHIWLRLGPHLHAEAANLVIRHKGRRDVPPLISAKNVVIDAALLGVWRKHVARVQLDGLEITIPPGGLDIDGQDADKTTPRSGVATSGPAETGSGNGSDERDGEPDLGREVIIDELLAPDATLTILRRDPNKKARVWVMHELHVQQVGARTEMPFKTRLTNAVPPGQIDTTGSFGPWRRDHPGHTPIEGAFTFENADLSVFKGISGTLNAHGSYTGTLERIDVNGQTETPDFSVNISRHKVLLAATYHATVDATNGNTTLEKIEAQFLNTRLFARGGVYDIEGLKGRIVTLDVEIEKGRLEDVLRLAVKTLQPTMTGDLRLHTNFELPPGDKDVIDRLRLDGVFTIGNGRFTNAQVQQKINELSHRARGKQRTEPRAKVGSDFSGRFKLGNGTLTLAKLTFDVPGAIVELTGRYGLESETLNFAGNLYMEAKVSQTMSGWKSLMLKIVDPLFRKNGRTVIPIRIAGNRDQPQFGLDAKRVF